MKVGVTRKHGKTFEAGYPKTMKRLLVALLGTIALAGCNENAEGDKAADTSAGNPAEVQPPSEAITDSTMIVNDSVIVPDTAPKNNAAPGRDTTPR